MNSNQLSKKEKNLALAMVGIALVYKRYPLGALNKKESFSSMGPSVYLCQMLLFSKLRNSHTEREVQENLHAILLSGKLRSAFCGEMACTAANFINSIDKDNTAELVKLYNGHHEMVVIGRDKNSNPNDINTWGENAVICDPWARKFYEASRFHIEQEEGEKIPFVEDINPSTGEILKQQDHYLTGSPRVSI